MCRDHQHGDRRCECCDPAARRAKRRGTRLAARGYNGTSDEEYCAATVAERAVMADEHDEAIYDPSPTVRCAAARGPLTEEAEAILSEDESLRVRRSLASNAACSAETLGLLSGDEDQGVRLAVAKHASTPPEALAGMADELDRRKDLGIARALAMNPRTPTEALAEWVESGTGGQRVLARAALRRRAEAAAEAVLTSTERLGAEMDRVREASADSLDAALGMTKAS